MSTRRSTRSGCRAVSSTAVLAPLDAVTTAQDAVPVARQDGDGVGGVLVVAVASLRTVARAPEPRAS